MYFVSLYKYTIKNHKVGKVVSFLLCSVITWFLCFFVVFFIYNLVFVYFFSSNLPINMFGVLFVGFMVFCYDAKRRHRHDDDPKDNNTPTK